MVLGLTHPLTERRKDVLSVGQNQCMSSARKFRLGFYIRKTHNLVFLGGVGGVWDGCINSNEFHLSALRTNQTGQLEHHTVKFFLRKTLVNTGRGSTVNRGQGTC